LPNFSWPVDYRYPDETFTDRLTIEVGGETFELFHDRGETDDATWVWSPGRRILFAGDMFIWASPNCGNPQKVQRFVREWADALDTMRALGAEVLLPGHGPPIESLGGRVAELERRHDDRRAQIFRQVAALVKRFDAAPVSGHAEAAAH